MPYSLQQRLLCFFFIFSSLKTKVMRVALLMTLHKRITVKTNGGQSIDANIKPTCFISYCRILEAHNAKHFIFFLLLIKLTQGNSFSML